MPAPPPLPDWVHDRRREHGRRIQLWRRERGLTQEQLAERTETTLSLSSIQRVEAGAEVHFSAIIIVADALAVPIGTLLTTDPGMDPPASLGGAGGR
ncbi:helix-turn-helix domain-containing protein [Streptomyces sp. NBC_01476]|uniref:helix-turn-helix domain-containing protein n=1 Tax=Streptomyces sp. NBC_01476 TaxID=2903881 RepID=UPI003FCC37D0